MRWLLSRKVNRINILTLLLIFCLALIFSLSFGYILIHADHHCTTDHCPICERMALCANAMLHLCGEWLVLAVISSLCASIILRMLPEKAYAMIQSTPVFRHVRMNC